MEWQTIETAPRDGSRFLVFGIPVGEIHNDLYQEPVVGVAVCEYGAFNAPDADCYTVNWRATHWMPIPKQPETK